MYSLATSFAVTVNVQSPSAATRDSHGNFTTYAAARVLLVREERDEAATLTATGEEKTTTHLWTCLEEIKTTDRVWLSVDSNATPGVTPPDLKKSRKPSSVAYYPGPGAHWEVRI